MALLLKLVSGMGHHGSNTGGTAFLTKLTVARQIQRYHAILWYCCLKTGGKTLPMPLFTD